MVEAFFAAVTPAELEAWAHAQEARHRAEAALDRAEAQQVERLRYQALLAERQPRLAPPARRRFQPHPLAYAGPSRHDDRVLAGV